VQKKRDKSANVSDRGQIRGFRKAARDLKADVSEERFDAALKKVARHKPKDDRATEKKAGG
jgi:hypothetical protein